MYFSSVYRGKMNLHFIRENDCHSRKQIVVCRREKKEKKLFKNRKFQGFSNITNIPPKIWFSGNIVV